jgi:hypothetical protein
MDVAQLRRLKPELDSFLRLFDDYFPRKVTHAYLPVFVSGQLFNLPRKSTERIAVQPILAPRTFPEFLSQHSLPEDKLRDRRIGLTLPIVLPKRYHCSVVDELIDYLKYNPAFLSTTFEVL